MSRALKFSATPPQRRVLLALFLGEPVPWARPVTLDTLTRAGLLVRSGPRGNDAYELTDAGREYAVTLAPESYEAADTPRSMRAPVNVPVYSELATERRTPHYATRRTVFLSITADTPLREVISFAVSAQAQRVLLTANGPALPEWWYLSSLPAEWKHGSHYLGDPGTSTGRYFRGTPGDPGRRIEVEIGQARPWFGDAGVDECTAAWTWLERWAGRQAPQARLLSTPVTTARDLWRRLIPATASYPILSDEVRQLVHATSPQHRRELLPPAGPDRLTGFAYLDARLAFAAVSWGLPVGPGAWVGRVTDGVEVESVLKRRGRVKVRTQVPKSWAHVGILPYANGSGTWEWPREGGRRFETWCDASEAHLALINGWPVEIVEGFLCAEGKPLNTFTDRITNTIASAELRQVEPVTRRAIRAGLRAMFVGLIGGFAQRGHDVWKSAPIRPGAAVPAPEGANVKRSPDGRTAFWLEHQARPDASFLHPEWSSTIWARARCRLLDGPAPARGYSRSGALHLPRSALIGFSADAILLDRDPRWPDDGQRGRFRLKGREVRFSEIPKLAGMEYRWPTNWDQINALRVIAGAD